MGSWGANSFENDWALDWLGDLCDSADDSPIRAALTRVVEHGGTKYSSPSILERVRGRLRHTDWLTANVSTKALAAAEVVAAWHDYPPANLPDRAAAWLNKNSSSFQPDLVLLARQAVSIVKSNSELKDLWEEGDPTEWRNVVGDLERRLALPAKR
jgi:hypothetical protein